MSQQMDIWSFIYLVTQLLDSSCCGSWGPKPQDPNAVSRDEYLSPHLPPAIPRGIQGSFPCIISLHPLFLSSSWGRTSHVTEASSRLHDGPAGQPAAAGGGAHQWGRPYRRVACGVVLGVPKSLCAFCGHQGKPFSRFGAVSSCPP